MYGLKETVGFKKCEYNLLNNTNAFLQLIKVLYWLDDKYLFS